MKINKPGFIITCLLTLFLFLMFNGKSFGWGFFVHKWISRMAIRSLPDEIRPFFEQYKIYLSEHSIDPDLWRNSDPDEGVRHFIDISMYGEYPFKELPRTFEDAKTKFGENTVMERGIAPWWGVQRFNQLVESMKQGNPDSIIADAAALGHYISDLYMPLHTVENYDGQLTGNDGIHARFEAWMMTEYAYDFDATVKKAEAIADPLSVIFQVVLDSYLLSDEIIQADSQAKKPDKVYIDREDYDKDYLTTLYNKVGDLATTQMSLAASTTSSFWYSAWIKAGKPELSAKNTQ